MEAVFVGLFAVHLLCVNVASVGPLVAVWLERRAARRDPVAEMLAGPLAWHGLVAFVLGVAAGLAYGLLLWSPAYREASRLLSNKIYYGVWELVFSLTLMTAHALWWRFRPRPGRAARWMRGTLALLAGTNLLYHFPLLMVVFARLATGDDSATAPLTPADFRARLADPTVLSRSIHFWLAAVATIGAWLLVIAIRWQSNPYREYAAGRIALWGGRIALIPTLLQIPAGVWLLSTLDPVAQARLLGGQIVPTIVFGVSVLLAMWLMHQLAAISMGEIAKPRLVRAVSLLVTVVLLMAAVLRQIEAG